MKLARGQSLFITRSRSLRSRKSCVSFLPILICTFPITGAAGDNKTGERRDKQHLRHEINLDYQRRKFGELAFAVDIVRRSSSMLFSFASGEGPDDRICQVKFFSMEKNGESKALREGDARPEVTELTLYSMRFCPYALRIRALLNLKKIPFVFHALNLRCLLNNRGMFFPTGTTW